MKTTKTLLIILIFYLGFLNSASGQVLTEEKNQSPQELYDFHMGKMKANKTAAWVTLGGGVAMIVGGFAINASTVTDRLIDPSKDINSTEGLWLSYVGGAATLASIPLFISSGKHYKKAQIQLQNGRIGFNKKITFSGVSIVFSF